MIAERGHNQPYDVAVIGGGPAGSTAAALLAEAGHKVVVVERERFPRYHIGESLLPASQRLFERLGIAGRLADEGFVTKRGATFLYEDGSKGTSIVFARGLDPGYPSTYQVDRARFDHLLLEMAISKGAEVRQSTRAAGVEFDGNEVRVQVVAANNPASTDRETLHARFLVDASGQAGFLAKRLELRRVDSDLTNVAVYAQFTNVQPTQNVPDGDIQVISRHDLSWIWLIPLSEKLTSVGAVLPREVVMEYKGRPKNEILEQKLASTQVVAEQMRSAQRASEVRFEADFSYDCIRYAGDRWLVAGDSGSFLDPVFSTGVLLALEAGEQAADALHLVLSEGPPSADAFGRYEDGQRKRYQHFRRYVRGFYDPTFRDLLFQPSDRLNLVEAVTSVFAGAPILSWKVRWRMKLIFLFVSLMSHTPLRRRLHDHSGTHSAE